MKITFLCLAFFAFFVSISSADSIRGGVTLPKLSIRMTDKSISLTTHRNFRQSIPWYSSQLLPSQLLDRNRARLETMLCGVRWPKEVAGRLYAAGSLELSDNYLYYSLIPNKRHEMYSTTQKDFNKSENTHSIVYRRKPHKDYWYIYIS